MLKKVKLRLLSDASQCGANQIVTKAGLGS